MLPSEDPPGWRRPQSLQIRLFELLSHCGTGYGHCQTERVATSEGRRQPLTNVSSILGASLVPMWGSLCQMGIPAVTSVLK